MYSHEQSMSQLVDFFAPPAATRLPSGSVSTQGSYVPTGPAIRCNVQRHLERRQRSDAGTGQDVRLWLTTPNRKRTLRPGYIARLKWPADATSTSDFEVEEVRPGDYDRSILIRDLGGRGEVRSS